MRKIISLLMRTVLLSLLFVMGLVVVSCDQKDNNPLIENNVEEYQGEIETADSVIVTQGNVVEHDFTRADPAPLEVSLTEQEKVMFASGYQFATGMFNQIAANTNTGNVCISPLSVQVMLGMLTNAVKDDVSQNILDKLFDSNITVDVMNSGFGKLRESLEATNCVKVPNAIWIQQGNMFNQDFIDIGSNIYQATVRNLNFRSDPQSAMDSVCQWAYDNSYGRLKSLDLDDFNCNTLMVLANLVWFASAWNMPFDTRTTNPGKFTLADGTVKNVDMMYEQEYMKYKFLDKYRVVSVPFKNNSFRMDFIVPADGYNLDEIIPDIDWSVSLQGGKKVSLTMPKFTVDYKADFKSVLSDYGLSNLFEMGAFDKITKTQFDKMLYISQMKQNAQIKVEEGGVEAVAVTVASIEYRSGSTVSFSIDRPFVFAIRDNASGSFLFMGRVNDIIW